MADSLYLDRWAVELFFVLYLLVSIGFVVLERRQPRTTLAWVLAIILLPGLGFVAYWVLGRRPYRRRARRSRRRREAANVARSQVEHLERLPAELSVPERGLVQLALRSAAAPLARAAAVELLPAGPLALASLRAAIEAAREMVHLEFYIWRDDHTGREMTRLLTQRARAGVKVRVLCDQLGSFGLPRAHFVELLDAGGEVAFSNPLQIPSLRGARANFRNHRKLVAVDQCVGFVGGLNIADEYLGELHTESLWRDLFVRLEGEAVLGLDAIFAADWLDAGGGPVEQEGHPPFAFGASPATTGAWLQIIASGPDAPVEEAIAAQFNAAIASAHSRCWIATPYLVPGEPLKLTLATAAMRGVDVRLLVPGRTDQWLVSMASASYYDRLLAAGCRIYEYPQMMHSKYVIVDESMATIGSANMDIRSFHLNYEVTAMFYDRGVNADLAEIFEGDLVQASRIRPEDRANLTPGRRLIEAIARVLSPLL
jgi:cardiolipin synthase